MYMWPWQPSPPRRRRRWLSCPGIGGEPWQTGDCYSTSHPVSAGIGSSCHSQCARNTRERGLAQALSRQEAPGHFNDLMGAGKVTAEEGAVVISRWSVQICQSKWAKSKLTKTKFPAETQSEKYWTHWDTRNWLHWKHSGFMGVMYCVCDVIFPVCFLLNLFTHFCFYLSICYYLNLSPFPFNYHCITHV